MTVSFEASYYSDNRFDLCMYNGSVKRVYEDSHTSIRVKKGEATTHQLFIHIQSNIFASYKAVQPSK